MHQTSLNPKTQIDSWRSIEYDRRSLSFPPDLLTIRYACHEAYGLSTSENSVHERAFTDACALSEVHMEERHDALCPPHYYGRKNAKGLPPTIAK